MPNAKHAPWALLPCILLALSSVSLLARPYAARADAPKAVPSKAAAHPALTEAYDDGDGDELLEHWGDPKYSREARVQMAGIAGIAALLVPALGLARRGRSARKASR